MKNETMKKFTLFSCIPHRLNSSAQNSMPTSTSTGVLKNNRIIEE